MESARMIEAGKVSRDSEGVDQDSLKVWIGNELLKIVQPNPRTPRDALSRAELAKSNLDAVHGHIVE